MEEMQKKMRLVLIAAVVLGIVSFAIPIVAAARSDCSGQNLTTNATNTYVIQASVGEVPFVFNLDPNGNMIKLDIPKGATYQSHTPRNMVTTFWAWRGDTDEIPLGFNQIRSCDMNGDFVIKVTEVNGKPVVAVSYSAPWYWLPSPWSK